MLRTQFIQAREAPELGEQREQILLNACLGLVNRFSGNFSFLKMVGDLLVVSADEFGEGQKVLDCVVQ